MIRRRSQPLVEFHLQFQLDSINQSKRCSQQSLRSARSCKIDAMDEDYFIDGQMLVDPQIGHGLVDRQSAPVHGPREAGIQHRLPAH